MNNSYDVIVVGGGLTGLATAYNAQKAGAKVLVMDRTFAGTEASSRATGYLSLRGETPAESVLAAYAEQLWMTLDQELGYPTEWTPKGRVWAATTDAHLETHKTIFKGFQTTAIEFEWVDNQAIREIVPALAPDVRGGIYTKRSGHANPQRTTQAYTWAFLDRGGVLLENAHVSEVIVESGEVKGVKSSQGTFYAPRVVLAAAGYNAKLLDGLGIFWPVAAARLEALVTTPLPHFYDVGLIINDEISVRQSLRGNFHTNGGPHEWVDPTAETPPNKPTSPYARNLVRRMLEALPVAKSAQVLRCWSGVVEFTPDQMTIIEKFDDPKGLIAAAGAGHGFGMAPANGVALAELALEGTTSAPVGGLKLDRFKDLDRDWQAQKKWNAGQFNT